MENISESNDTVSYSGSATDRDHSEDTAEKRCSNPSEKVVESNCQHGYCKTEIRQSVSLSVQ